MPDVGKKPEQDRVITIDLLSLPPAAPAPMVEQQVVMPQAKTKAFSAPQSEPVQQAKTTEPVPQTVDSEPEVTKKKILEVPDPVPEVTPQPEVHLQSSARTKPISLRPLKRKKRLAEDIRLAEVKELEEKKKQQEQERQARLAALERKRLAEQKKRELAAEREKKLVARKEKEQQARARKRQADQRRREREIAEAARLARQAEQAAEQARLEAAALKREYASVAQAVSSLNDPISSRSSGFSADSRGWDGNGVYSGSGSEQINPAVLNQYIASLNRRISSQWQLPEILKKKKYLKAVVALTVRRDGSVKDMRIEQKSGDSFFDQSVIKALQSSAPFPVFPALLDQSTLEFTLNFTPDGLAL